MPLPRTLSTWPGWSWRTTVLLDMQADDAASDEFGPPEQVEVSVDNITTASYSLVCGDTAVRALGMASRLELSTSSTRLSGWNSVLSMHSDSLLCVQVSVVCRDRKGLVYDLMRTMKDIEVGC